MSSATGLIATRTLPGFSITEFAQAPHRRLPWHEHRHASVCFVVSGTYAERARGREEECASRSMVFKPAAERHADVFGRSGGRCLLVEILPERLASLSPFSQGATVPRLARSARLAALGMGLYREFKEHDAAAPLALEGGILEVLAEESRQARRDSGAPPAWLRRVRDFLHDHVQDPITLSSLAREAGVHPSHLARTFRTHFRRSIGAYLRALRIERATRDLADPRITISEIGLRAGFYDHSHFTKVFRRHTGMTPAEFRAFSS